MVLAFAAYVQAGQWIYVEDPQGKINSFLFKSYVLFIPFLVFGHFWRQRYENTKIFCNLCLHLHFARQDGQDGKNGKENHATKVTKILKTKKRKYGMNET